MFCFVVFCFLCCFPLHLQAWTWPGSLGGHKRPVEQEVWLGTGCPARQEEDNVSDQFCKPRHNVLPPLKCQGLPQRKKSLTCLTLPCCSPPAGEFSPWAPVSPQSTFAPRHTLLLKTVPTSISCKHLKRKKISPSLYNFSQGGKGLQHIEITQHRSTP